MLKDLQLNNRNNIAKTSQNISKKSDSMSLIDRAIQERKIAEKTGGSRVFLLDLSSSMNETIDGKPKINHLRRAIQDYPNSRKVSFSDDIWDGIIPENGEGGTNMVIGFRYLLSIIPKPSSIVLISDGLPDDEELSILEALKLHVPVDIVYIGEKESKGEAFMKRLSNATKGRIFVAETNRPQFATQLSKHISTSCAGYLTAGTI